MSTQHPSSLKPALVLSLTLLLAAFSAAAAPTRISLGSSSEVSAPGQTRPMDERRFDFEKPAEEVIELAWSELPRAALYQVQISGSDDFSSPLNERQQLVLGEPATRAELSGLPAGGYYWRVAGVDSQGRRGTWSSVRRFSVNEGPPPATGEGPPLKISSAVPAGDRVIISGTTVAGVRVEASVNGEAAGDIPVNDSGEFSAMLDANVLGRNVVRLIAVDERGRSSTAETSFHYGGG